MYHLRGTDNWALNILVAVDTCKSLGLHSRLHIPNLLMWFKPFTGVKNDKFKTILKTMTGFPHFIDTCRLVKMAYIRHFAPLQLDSCTFIIIHPHSGKIWYREWPVVSDIKTLALGGSSEEAKSDTFWSCTVFMMHRVLLWLSWITMKHCL